MNANIFYNLYREHFTLVFVYIALDETDELFEMSKKCKTIIFDSIDLMLFLTFFNDFVMFIYDYLYLIY
jgi:hypothetical protein